MKMWLTGLALFASLVGTARADIIAGSVIDLASKRPVANAKVTVRVESGAPAQQTNTDSAGRFLLDVEEAPFELTVQAPGFDPYVMRLAAVHPSVLANLHIAVWRKIVWEHGMSYRRLCGAFQPGQLWDHYVLDPSGVCGTRF